MKQIINIFALFLLLSTTLLAETKPAAETEATFFCKETGFEAGGEKGC